MSLKLNLKKIRFTKSFCFLIFWSCQTPNSASFTNRKFKDLIDYKKMAQYIVMHNYHYGFTKNDTYVLSNAPDSTVSKFIREKKIIGIYFNRDSLIRFSIGFKSILSKGKELSFDYSSCSPTKSEKRNGYKKIVLEKGIYYVEY
ncbi:hypothetical protein SAMN05444266_10587 [Chitinophaga jiangningensis]|uniref:Uncharacterized protein n=1 Tax=Chitinophaga jiangningensis TaxID=1419482 RepID=A0A1M7DQD4_9BACT|nr:hypothetical protein SAMN05444266_10587 [Chitinophaga jiangningensis]